MSGEQDYMMRFFPQHHGAAASLPIMHAEEEEEPADPVQKLKDSSVVENFLESIRSDTNNKNKKDAAKLLSQYLATHHNDAFCSAIHTAEHVKEELDKKKKRRRKVVPIVPGLKMYDGGAPDETFSIRWNKRYAELLAFHAQHGHCLVPSRPPTELSRWIGQQRKQKKDHARTLTPKRIEMLDKIGFAWVLNADCYQGAIDPMFHKAVAAKIVFGSSINATEASLLAGFPKTVASHKSRRMLLNDRVQAFHENSMRANARQPIQKIVQQIQQAPNLDAVLQQVYGVANDWLIKLRHEGKLVMVGNHTQIIAVTAATTNNNDTTNSDEPAAKKPRIEGEDDAAAAAAATGSSRTSSNKKRAPLPLPLARSKTNDVDQMKATSTTVADTARL